MRKGPARKTSYASASTFRAVASNNYATVMPGVVWAALVCGARLAVPTVELERWWCSPLGLSGDPLAPRPPGGPDPPV